MNIKPLPYNHIYIYVIFKDVKRCYCENKNGGIGKNGIICKDEMNTVTTTSCQESEGCIGATEEINAVMVTRLLCEKGESNTSIVNVQ